MARFTARVALVAVFLTAVAASASAQSVYQSLKSGGMTFATGASSPATERMRISQGGLIGIGNTAPAATLQVSGSFIVSQSGQNTTPSLYVSATSGYVGVGTSNPASKLDINGTSATLMLGNSTDTTTQDELLRFRIGSSGSATGYMSFTRAGGPNSNFRIGYMGDGSLDVRGGLDTGNVISVGDLYPNSANSSKTIVFGSSNGSISARSTFYSHMQNSTTVPVRIVNGQTGTGANAALAFGSVNSVGTEYDLARIEVLHTYFTGTNLSGGLAFEVTNGSTTLNEAMRISNTGLVGINTSNPSTNLEVSGTISATHFVGDGSGLTGIAGGGGSGDRIVSTSANVVAGYGGYVSLSTGGVSGTSYFNTTGQWIGPGVSATGAISATTLYSSGDVNYIGSINDLSDRRAKTDITPLPEDVLARILKLRPISFRMKSGGGLENGFIAQEVQPLFPELVKDGPLLSLNYVGMISPIVKALQQMQAANDNLAARVDTLELENKSLRARLDALAGEFAQIRRARR